MWLEDISMYALGAIIFAAQIGFLFSRTLNVIYTAEQNTPGALITGGFVHIMWLISISIGVKSVMYLDFFVILCSLAGGLLGTHYGIKLKKWLIKRKNAKKLIEENKLSNDLLGFVEKNIYSIVGNDALVYKYDENHNLIDIYYSVEAAANKNELSKSSIYKSVAKPFKRKAKNHYYIKKE